VLANLLQAAVKMARQAMRGCIAEGFPFARATHPCQQTLDSAFDVPGSQAWEGNHGDWQ
jgi:hypothetical protein